MKWQPFETAPEDDCFLVWLKEPAPTMSSRIAIMRRHPNGSIINGLFAYDMPEPTLWQPLPLPPLNPLED